jgi:hypothetical protein
MQQMPAGVTDCPDCQNGQVGWQRCPKCGGTGKVGTP